MMSVMPPFSHEFRLDAARLFAQHAEDITLRLQRRYIGVDPDRITDAVVEAILACPSREPEPVRFLYRFARQRLRIFLRGDRRRREREVKAVQHAVTEGRLAVPSPVQRVSMAEDAARIRSLIVKTAEEEQILELWLNGITDPEEVASHMANFDAESSTERARTLLARLRKRFQREREREQQRQSQTDSEEQPG
jgi:hypothetical protein